MQRYLFISLSDNKFVKMSSGKTFQRLPLTVRAEHYDISLQPDLNNFTYNGQASIHIKVLQETREIILNSIDLELKDVILKGSKEYIPVKTIQSEDETVKFVFSEVLPLGNYQLGIGFKGHINFTLRGFYRSKYVDQKGEEKYAAVTQFCATDARRCFPCWDEPALKATFDITLTVNKELTALSNMPVINTKEHNGLITYKFDRTPIMSTYLVAFVVGEYDYIEDTTDGVKVRVYTPKGKQEQGRFALEVTTKILPFYNNYFKIAYPLPKIDLVTVADFSFGAMENWGLVTYRETRLLIDPKNSSASNKQIVAEVVGHELAHQWFGNLVTMEWWTDLWLNEGYASFVPNLGINQLFPNYNIWTQFVNNVYIRALQLDSLQNSHPVEIPINNPHELFEIFDAISYNKGASIIRMLHHFIGDDDFRKGMTLYLTRHKYNNTKTEDLWQALEEGSGKPIRRMMSTWTKQLGYPVITLTTTQTPEGIQLNLTQEKFTADGSSPNEDFSWVIPIDVVTSTDNKYSLLLDNTKDSILIPQSNLDWIKINPGTIGFYRTKYPPEMLAKLTPAISSKTLPPLDRLGLIDDLYALVKAGHTGTIELLKTLKAYEQDDDYNVWASIANILDDLGNLLEYGNLTKQFKTYQSILLQKLSTKIFWEASPDDNHIDTLKRVLVLNLMVSLNDSKTIEEAKKRFSLHLKSEKILPADLRTIVYKAVLSSGGKKEFDLLLELYRSTDLHEEKNRIIAALGVTKDADLLSRVLEFSMSKDVRAQDTPSVIISAANSRLGRDLAWNYFKANANSINDRLSTVLLTRLVKVITQNFATYEKATEVEEFFQKNPMPGTERSVQQAVETIKLNAGWLQRDLENIKQFLERTIL